MPLIPILEALASAIAVAETIGSVVIGAITLFIIFRRIVGLVRGMGKS